MADSPLTFRRIDPAADAALVIAHQRDACAASFGDDSRFQGNARYLAWLATQVDEFPDGCVLAFQGGRCAGQLEMAAPYGSPVGYISLFYVAPAFRGRGVAGLLNDYAERYFRSWEATRVELHVSAVNTRAVKFYSRLGYRRVDSQGQRPPVWRMVKELGCIAGRMNQ